RRRGTSLLGMPPLGHSLTLVCHFTTRAVSRFCRNLTLAPSFFFVFRPSPPGQATRGAVKIAAVIPSDPGGRLNRLSAASRVKVSAAESRCASQRPCVPCALTQTGAPGPARTSTRQDRYNGLSPHPPIMRRVSRG